MKTKPIEKITIEEMTAKAGVGRTTYFRYFRNKDQVLLFKLICMFEDDLKERGLDYQNLPEDEGGKNILEFFARHQDVVQEIYKAGRKSVLLDFFLKLIEPEKEKAALQNSIKAYYLGEIFSYICFGFFNAWVERDFAETPDELTLLLQQPAAQ